MQKGYSLIELLAMLVVLTAFGLASSRLFFSMSSDVPKIFKSFQAHQTREHLFALLQKDMDNGESLPARCDALVSSPSVLLIRSGESIIKYDWADRIVKRTIFKISDCTTAVESRSWVMPRTEISFTPVIDSRGSRYAVELSSFIEQSRTGGREKLLRTARMFFVGACASRGERR